MCRPLVSFDSPEEAWNLADAGSRVTSDPFTASRVFIAEVEDDMPAVTATINISG